MLALWGDSGDDVRSAGEFPERDPKVHADFLARRACPLYATGLTIVVFFTLPLAARWLPEPMATGAIALAVGAIWMGAWARLAFFR